VTEEGRLVTRIFDELERAGIASVVLRNHEALPERIGNDLDLLVDPARRESAEEVVTAAAAEAGWVLLNRAEFVPTGLYFWHADSGAVVQIDLFHGLWWRGLEILPALELLRGRRRVGPHHVPDPVAESALHLLSGVVYSGNVKRKYRERMHGVARDDPERLADALRNSCSARLAARLVEIAAGNRWPELERAVATVRRALLANAMRSPGPSARRLGAEAGRVLRRFMRPPGLMIAILGPDGAGKSTAAANLVDDLSVLYRPERGRSIHWRPTVRRPPASAAKPVTDPHGSPPRAPLLSALFLSYHWARFVTGSWLGLQPVLFRNGLVLCDRYFEDFYVDRRRYRLNVPGWLVSLFDRGYRKPDLTIVLDVNAEVARGRKAEIDPGELDRQRDAYRRLVARSETAFLVDASRSPEHVRSAMMTRVRNTLIGRIERDVRID
jgi:thymidylate kinase